MSDHDLEKRLTYWREIKDKWAEAEARRVRLDNWRKVVLSEQMKEAEKRGVTAIAAQERDARASDAYKEAILALEAATEEAFQLNDERLMARTWAAAWQTERADQRKEREAYRA